MGSAFGLLIGAAVGLAPASAPLVLTPKPRVSTSYEQQVVEVVAHLSASDVRVGDTVRLTETSPSVGDRFISRIRHTVLRIGDHEQKSGVFLIPDHKKYEFLLPDNVFQNLPAGLKSSRSLIAVIPRLKMAGAEFDFVPTSPGVYLVNVSWQLEDENRYVASPPAVLVVRPRTK